MVKKIKLSATILILTLLFSIFLPYFQGKKVFAVSASAVDYEKEDLSASYEFELKSDGYYITAYLGNELNIELPDYYNGIPITGIADGEYRQTNGVFADKDILQVKMGANIKFIGRGAFRDCEKLESVIMNDKVQFINSYAFYNCSSLYQIDLPEIKQLGHDTFTGSGWYNEIENAHINSQNDQRDFYYENEYNKILLKVTKIASDTYTVQEGTTLIAQQAFLTSIPLSKLNLPSSVKYLGNYLLGSTNPEDHQNSNIDYTSCQITVNGKTIDEFSKTVNFGQTSFSLVGNTYPQTQYANAKYFGKALVLADKNFIAKDFAVVDGTVQIASAAFGDCLKIEKVTLPESVTYIGENAFRDCKNLKEIVILGQVTIADNAFINCISLQKVSGKIIEVGANAFKGCTALENIDLSVVQTVKEFAFNGATALSEVVISDNAVVCENAFKNTALTNGKSGLIFVGNHLVGVGAEVTELTLNGKSVANGALVGSNIVNANLSNVILGKGAFFGCEKLESVVFDGNLLPDYCFSGATKLSALNASVSVVGERALENTAITEFDFSQTEKVGEHAFSGSKLSSASLNDRVELGDYAFFNTPLTAITVDANNPLYSHENEILYNKDKTEILVYPSQKAGETLEISATVIGKGAFAFAKNLRSVEGEFVLIKDKAFYGSKVTELSTQEVESVGEKAFYDSDLTALNLPLLTNAGYKAFAYSAINSINLTNNQFNRRLGLLKGAKNLTEMQISFNYENSDEKSLNLGYLFGTDYFEGSYGGYQKYSDRGSLIYYIPQIQRVTVTDGKVSVGAFMNMKHLKSVTLNSQVIGIGSSAFAFCENLTTVTFGNEVKSLGKESFAGCKNLTSIDLLNIARIDDFAFKGCLAINEIIVSDSLVYIGNGAFSECENLTSVKVESQAFFNNYDNDLTDYGLLFENAQSVTVGNKSLTADQIKSLREIASQGGNGIGKTKLIVIVSLCIAIILIVIYFIVRHFKIKNSDDFTRSRKHKKRR